MSDPILRPEMPRTAADPSVSPLRLLAMRYPRGGIASLGMLFILGAWLLVSASFVGYVDHPLAKSDQISGAVILAVSLIAAIRMRPWIAWVAGAVGLWVLLAPIALWAPSLGAYITGTLAGTLIATVGLVIPLSWLTPGEDIPAGWSYNPSSWRQRAPVIALAAVSTLIAGYLAAYQLGVIGAVWDPVFGDGTRRVLESDVSRAWPVSDAGLGAAMFVVDLLMTCAGDRRRWRTMPWLVLLFGLMIIPIGIVSIVLVILQPVAVGAWCFWCLLTAATTLAMIPLAIDEVTASVQLLRHTAHRGGSWWRVLWLGDHRGAAPAVAPRRAHGRPPWTLGVMALAGAWLMIEPAIIDVPAMQADASRVAGALLIVVAAIAVAELARPLRFAAVPIALWVVASPWLLVDAPTTTRLTGLVAAIAIVFASWPRGVISQRHGTADRIAAWPDARSV